MFLWLPKFATFPFDSVPPSQIAWSVLSRSPFWCQWYHKANSSRAANYDYLAAQPGSVVRYDPQLIGRSAYETLYAWYGNRILPDESLKGLTRLKGHLQKDHWLTKVHKTFSKEELADDMILIPIPKNSEVTFTRLLPTSSARLVRQREQDVEGREAAARVKSKRDDDLHQEWKVKPAETVENWQGSSCNGNVVSPLYLDSLQEGILSNWSPPRSRHEIRALVLDVTVKKDGSLVSVEVNTSSGSASIDNEAMAAARARESTPLPQWYTGESLTFRVTFDKDH